MSIQDECFVCQCFAYWAFAFREMKAKYLLASNGANLVSHSILWKPLIYD